MPNYYRSQGGCDGNIVSHWFGKLVPGKNENLRCDDSVISRRFYELRDWAKAETSYEMRLLGTGV